MRELSFEAKDRSIADVMFAHDRFSIPRYQRPYSWNDDQITDFWNDLKRNDDPYFLGSFIFNLEHQQKTGYIEVIDGQQRMLTITIFLAVLRDISRNLDPKTASKIQQLGIFNEGWDDEPLARIKCGDSTQDFFEKNIQKEDSDIRHSSPNTREEARIKKNYEFFCKKIDNDLKSYSNNSDKVTYLKNLREKISELIVIVIKIKSEEDAYEIFETTNARGVELSVADLLKNLIFKEIPAKDGGDIAKDRWSEIVSNIQQTGTELKKFIRYYWISKYSVVSEKKLFREIKRNITNWQDFLHQLYGASNLYNKLIEGTEDEWNDYKNGHKIYRAISAIKYMDIYICYVLFLSILRNFDKLGTNPSKIFQLIEKFTFIYSAVCKLPINRIEKIYSTYAEKLETAVKEETEKKVSGRIQSIFEDLRNELIKEKPSFEVFRDSFKDIGYGRSEKQRVLVKYILNEISNMGSTGERRIDFHNVNIEHILPKKPGNGWGLKKSQIKCYVDKLGNLTLLSKKLNSRADNKDLRQKIEIYKQSDIEITKKLVEKLEALGENSIWNEEEITNRQEELANISYHKVWDF